MITPEIERIAKKASIKILHKGDDVIIKNIFDINNKSNIGVLFLLLGGALLTYTGIISYGELIIKIIFILLGVFMSVCFLWVFIAQFLDRLILTNAQIIAVHKLKKTKWACGEDIKALMKSEQIVVKRVKSHQKSVFCVVHLYIKSGRNETRIFTFQMDKSDSAEADKFGEIIAQIINKKIAGAKN